MMDLNLCSLYPYLQTCTDFVREAGPGLQEKCRPRNANVVAEDVMMIPVGCLRWTHCHINSKLQFKDGRSMLKLLNDLWRGKKKCESIDPLDVVVVEAGNDVKLYATSNRRLTVISAL